MSELTDSLTPIGFIRQGGKTWRLDGEKMNALNMNLYVPDPKFFTLVDPLSDDELPFESNIAFYAFRYALGRMSMAPSTVVDYLINHADAIPRKDKYLMLDEINKAIIAGHAGMQMDIDQWERLRARLSVTYQVHTLFDGVVSSHTCYLWKGEYYTENMRSFVAPEYITSIDEPLADAADTQ